MHAPTIEYKLKSKAIVLLLRSLHSITHGVSYLAAAVGKKAHLRTKQHRAVKKSSPLHSPLLSYMLAEGIS